MQKNVEKLDFKAREDFLRAASAKVQFYLTVSRRLNVPASSEEPYDTADLAVPISDQNGTSCPLLENLRGKKDHHC